MTFTLTSSQRRAVIAALVVCVFVNAVLYLTVSYTKPSSQRDSSHHGDHLLQQGDLQATARPRLKAPSWIKAINTDLLHVQDDEHLSSNSTPASHQQSHILIKLNSTSTSSSLSLGKHLKGSLQSADSTTMAAHGAKGTDEFDAFRVLQLFQSCRQENGELLMDCYNDAYEELCKLFKLFGTAFTFVTSDVVEKIGILRDYRKSEVGVHYQTIQTMVKYEVDNNLTNQKKKASGCRTLLRLHRALEFISALLAKIRDTDNKSKFSHEATAAYDTTLAKYHPWLIRKAVHVAMYILPNREQLLAKMKVEDTPEGKGQINKLIEQLDSVYDITQELYSKNNLLDLP